MRGFALSSARQTEAIIHDCRADLARIKLNQELLRQEIEQARREISICVQLLRRIDAVLHHLPENTRLT